MQQPPYFLSMGIVGTKTVQGRILSGINKATSQLHMMGSMLHLMH